MDSATIITHILEGHAEKMKKLDGISKKRSAFGLLSTVAKEGEYFLGITGLRGIGKTVLLLQLAYENNAIYLSADDRNLRGVDIYDAVKALSEAGHKKIFIDEIHSKPNWDKDLKTIYDEGLAYVAFSGSSAIQIKTLKADLSRRVVIEHIEPASFREWLWIRKEMEFPQITLEQLIKDKVHLTKKYAETNKFRLEYCKTGGVLYQAKTQFYKTIMSTIETIAYKDLTAIKDVDKDTVENFFKLLQIVAFSKPMELSYSTIGEALGKDKVWVMRFLHNVERTETIKRVYACGSGPKPFRKEAKYYLPFPYRASLCTTSGKTADIGAMREEFFANHTNCCYIKTSSSATADFEIDKKTFEVGGPSKGRTQGADYIVPDSLDTTANRLPLFLFGFLR